MEVLQHGSGFPNAGRVRWSASTAPPSAAGRVPLARCRPACGCGCGRLPGLIRDGAGVRRIGCCAARAWWSTASGVRRYWAEEGLTRPARTRKKQRIGPQRGDRLAATRPDEVWALDFQVDVSTDGRQIRFCNAVDEFTRQALATTAARSFTADDTTILLDKIIAETGRRPQNLRMDNGPELTAAAMRDWCRFGKGLPAPSGLLIEFAALSEQCVYGRMLALIIISQTAVGRGRTPLGGR